MDFFPSLSRSVWVRMMFAVSSNMSSHWGMSTAMLSLVFDLDVQPCLG